MYRYKYIFIKVGVAVALLVDITDHYRFIQYAHHLETISRCTANPFFSAIASLRLETLLCTSNKASLPSRETLKRHRGLSCLNIMHIPFIISP